MTTPKPEEVRVTKSACERYDVRVGRDWAVVTVFEFGGGGGLGILSSYGNWAYGWSHPGEAGLKPFLLDLDNSRDYLIGKLTHGRPKQFDCEATVAKIKRWIEEDAHNLVVRRADKELWGLDTVAEAHESLESIGCSWQHSPDGFVFACLENEHLSWLGRKVCDGICVMVPERECVGFVEKLWPAFVAEIRRELAAAKEES